MKKSFPEKPITEAQAEEYELISPQLDAMIGEVKELSKKKPNEALNVLKVKMLNNILERVINLLSKEPTSDFLQMLDEDTLPSASDASFVLAQHASAMQQFHERYHGWDGTEHRWFTSENPRYRR